MGRIPEHIVEQIRDAVDVVEVVGRYVTLRKSGRNYSGLCPFHQEKTPSFTVNAEKQIFHCFGCGVGGNVFAFLMRHENLSFIEALKRFSGETGIAIPQSLEARQYESESEKLFQANQTAQQFFRQNLQYADAQIKEYLHKRGIQAETIESFGLGYVPEGWDGLIRYLKAQEKKIGPYEKLGLVLSSEKSGKLYDRFRQRLMFPIHNTSGKIVGFGGRTLSDDPRAPKYLNSPESTIYVKSQVLYGLFFAREAIREKGFVIFVEGYMDLIQLYQHNIRNVAATSGTALTEGHAQLIRRYTGQVCLCYDADEAGMKAAIRGGEILFQRRLEVEVLILPKGEDPDSYVKKHGREAFEAAVKKSQSYWDFRLAMLRKKYNLQKANERSLAVGELLDVLLMVQDNISRNFYIEKLAENLQIPRELLLNELQQRQRRQKSHPAVPFPEKSPQPPPSEKPRPMLVFKGAWGGEKDIILLLLNFFDEIQEYVFRHLETADFLNPEFQHLYQVIKSAYPEISGSILHFVLEKIENESLRALLLQEMEQSNREFSKPALYLQGCIKQIKIARYQANINIARRRIKDLTPRDPDYMTLLKEMQHAMTDLKKWQDVVCREE